MIISLVTAGVHNDMSIHSCMYIATILKIDCYSYNTKVYSYIYYYMHTYNATHIKAMQKAIYIVHGMSIASE